MFKKVLEINLFGACIVRGASGAYEITSSKQKALLVLLATAPFGKRTRPYLQELLWGTSGFEDQERRQSLRTALKTIKKIMVGDFEELITTNNSELTLDLNKVHFIGQSGGAEFLEGIDINENGFDEWLRGMRNNPEQVFALFSPSTQSPHKIVIKPTIAIVPFRVVQGSRKHSVLGDWLAEETCRSLSRSNLMSVISHLSSRELSKRYIELKMVHELLGSDYCVTGSIREVQGLIMVDVDMLDAHSGRIMWTRNFTGQMGDFIGSDPTAVNNIVQSIGRSIASDAITHTHGRPLKEIANHQLLAAGVGLLHERKLSRFIRSKSLIEEAVSRAPYSADAHSWLAEWYFMSVFNGWSTDIKRDTENAKNLTSRALDINPENSFAITVDGIIHNNLLHELDVAENRFVKALEINPNESRAWLSKGALHTYRDEAELAIEQTEHALMLSPLDPMTYLFETTAASAYLSAGQHENALILADKSLKKNSRHLSTLRTKICALHHLDRNEEAQQSADLLLKYQPDFTQQSYIKNHPAAEYEIGKKIRRSLIAAGIPEGK